MPLSTPDPELVSWGPWHSTVPEHTQCVGHRGKSRVDRRSVGSGIRHTGAYETSGLSLNLFQLDFLRHDMGITIGTPLRSKLHEINKLHSTFPEYSNHPVPMSWLMKELDEVQQTFTGHPSVPGDLLSTNEAFIPTNHLSFPSSFSLHFLLPAMCVEA